MKSYQLLLAAFALAVAGVHAEAAPSRTLDSESVGLAAALVWVSNHQPQALKTLSEQGTLCSAAVINSPAETLWNKTYRLTACRIAPADGLEPAATLDIHDTGRPSRAGIIHEYEVGKVKPQPARR